MPAEFLANPGVIAKVADLIIATASICDALKIKRKNILLKK